MTSPTKQEKARISLCKEIGCIACRIRLGVFEPCEIHHLTEGGKHGAPRLGHRMTIPLCPWHHRGHLNPGESSDSQRAIRGPSYAMEPKTFRQTFGDDQGLLDATDRAIGWPTLDLMAGTKIVPRVAA